MKARIMVIACLMVLVITGSSAQISSAATGSWNTGATWVGGVVPIATDNVIIVSGHTITVDVNTAACNDLTVNGKVTFPDVDALALTINGNALVGTTGDFNVFQTGSPVGAKSQTITIKGNLTVSTPGKFDMRKGSNPNSSAGTVVFSGNTNSTISLSLTAYLSSQEEFNSVTINKTGGAKVVLATGNLFMSNNTTTLPSVLTMTSGIIETGANNWVDLATSANSVVGANSSSYVNGSLGRGLSTSAATGRLFEVGDANGLRPVRMHTTALVASGGYIAVRAVAGDAFNSSTFAGGIDKVSAVRYYQITFNQGTGATTSATLDSLWLTYGNDDGVVAANPDLRVAYSSDARATWTGLTQTIAHTSDLSAPPTTIAPDLLSPTITINTGTSIYAALARNTGTTTNSLPVEITSFSASSNRLDAVLHWTTSTEKQNYGFAIERKFEAGWEKAGFISGAGTSNSPKDYSFIDRALASGRYTYRLKQIDNDGSFKYHGTEAIVEVGVAPKTLMLEANYPNPFNPTTEISFSVPENGYAALKVHNALGQEVATLFSGMATAGHYITASFNGAKLSSGVYFARLEYNGKNIVQRMLLTK